MRIPAAPPTRARLTSCSASRAPRRPRLIWLTIDGNGGVKLQAPTTGNDLTGFSVSAAGDVDGDGYDDILVGAPAADGAGNAESAAGATYFLRGSETFGGSTSAVDLPGNSFDDFNGNTAGADIWVGGNGDDIFAILAPAIPGGGADSMRGGEGNDRMEVPDSAFRRIDGGTGFDTVKLTNGITLVDTDFRKVSDIELLELANAANTLTLGRDRDPCFRHLAGHAPPVRNNGIDRMHINGAAVTDFAVTVDGSAMLQGFVVHVENADGRRHADRRRLRRQPGGRPGRRHHHPRRRPGLCSRRRRRRYVPERHRR